MLYRRPFLTAKQGSNLFSLWYKALKFANIYSFTLVQSPFFLNFMPPSTPLDSGHSSIIYHPQKFLKYWFLCHCFLSLRSDMRSCCFSPEILQSSMPWYDHSLSSFHISHTYIPGTNNFSTTASCFCLYQKHLVIILLVLRLSTPSQISHDTNTAKLQSWIYAKNYHLPLSIWDTVRE